MPSFTKWAWWTVVLGMVAAPLHAAAQEDGSKPAPVVEEQDLGDGFRAVSVNGGPPAIIDDETGLILKEIGGRLAVVDQEAGVILYSGDDGEPQVKFYGGAGKGNAPGGEPAPEKLERMRAFLDRVQAHPAYRDRVQARRERADGDSQPPEAKPADRLARVLALLDAAADESAAIEPLLRAVLAKQDEIRRSVVDLGSARDGKVRARSGVSELPPAIRALHGILKVGHGLSGDALREVLAGYRSARRAQNTELAERREQLREVLTLHQEAKLTAVGILD